MKKADCNCNLPFYEFFVISFFIQVSLVRELTEVKEVITPYGRSGSEETKVQFFID